MGSEGGSLPDPDRENRSSARTPDFRGEVVGRRRFAGFIVTELRHRRPSRNASHEHGLSYFSLLTRGEYVERDAAGEIVYRRGAVRFHPAGYRHGDEIGPSGASFLCIELSTDLTDEISGLNGAPRLEPPASKIARLSLAMNREMRANDGVSNFLLEGLAMQLVGTFLRLPVESRIPPWLRRVADHLREESSRSLSLGELALEAGVHPVHLARSFRRHYHRSIGEELRRHRVEAVQAAIVRGDVSLCDAAAAAGFADQSHMSRIFRRLTGMSPREYRVRFVPRS